MNPKSFDINELSEFMSKAIAERPEIRYQILGIVSDRFVERKELSDILYEIKTLREEFEENSAAWNAKFEENSAAWNAKFEAGNAAWNAEMKALRQEFEENSAAWNDKFEEESAAWNAKFEEESAAWRAEMKALRQDFNEESAAWNAKFEAGNAAWRAEMKVLRQDSNNKFSAIGARWGINTEESFREGLKGILEDFRGIKVEHFIGFDNEGVVFGRPDQVELDVVVKDGILILVEIKSSVSRSDVTSFQRKVDWYEKEHDVKVNRKVIISPMIDLRAIDEIDYYGIETYSGSDADI